LPEDGTFFVPPDPEFAYYAERTAVSDYRVYFLKPEDLKEVLDDMGVSYVVLPLALRLPDEAWNHVGKAPMSFVERIKADYPLVYTTPAGDIEVYGVR
jgi:hypothetical protein